MKYGLIERKRTTSGEDTSWYWLIYDPDDVDREETSEMYEPGNSLFWYYPAIYTKEQALEKMLAKHREQVKKDIRWEKHNMKVVKVAADKYLTYGFEPEDFDKTEMVPTDDEVIEQAEKDFYNWFRKNGKVWSDEEGARQAWMACFRRENLIEDNK